MKKSNEHSIMVDQFELGAIKSSPIRDGVIRKLRDDDGNLTAKTNVREWEDIFFIDFPSEASRDAWLKEIAYTFAKIGFWRTNRLEFLDVIDDSAPEHSDDELAAARRQYETEQAECQIIGIDAYLLKLDREFSESFGVAA